MCIRMCVCARNAFSGCGSLNPGRRFPLGGSTSSGCSSGGSWGVAVVARGGTSCHKQAPSLINARI